MHYVTKIDLTQTTIIKPFYSIKSIIIQEFIVKNWFDLTQSIFIISGFILHYFTLRHDIRSRKIESILYINESYRQIWNKTYSQPELNRIRETNIDLKANPITEPERRISKEVIFHIYAVYEAVQNKQIEMGEMDKDIYDYLSLPIPNTVWNEVRIYLNKKFVIYIDKLLQKRRQESVELV